MNKSALRKFAVEARLELREKVKIKALKLGITEDGIKKESVQSSDSVFIDGKQLTIEEQRQRNKLIEVINIKGYSQVIEEVAYTWFNRFTALRFMEVNNYLPTKVRVLSSSTEGSYEPDIIKEALNIDLDVDKDYIYELRLSNDNDAIDKLYKYLIIKQCNALGEILPFMFEKILDYTELLFPDGLLNEGSFLRVMTDTDNIPEEDWEEIEIIGWLYQYYISEENQRVIQAKKRYKKEEIPFATQLFTPNWIVRYMVQNALGRYWIESHPEDRDLIKEWEFYLENTNPESDFEEKLAPFLNKSLKVEEIKCFDPAMGSGHILVYMFDLLYQIYSKCGYMEREIPKLIIENNLYGLEIDDRAYQLACFAVIMKAQQYNNRFLRNLDRQIKETGEYIKLNLASIQETNDFSIKDIEYIAGESKGKDFDKIKRFIEQFNNAKIYGSLTEIFEFDEEFLLNRAKEIISNPVKRIEYQSSKNKVDGSILDLIKQARIMNDIYDVLVTNPPYIGNRYLHPLLNDFLSDRYSDVKSDIFSAFIVYSFNKTIPNGQLGFMTPFVWMFISSYEKLREKIIGDKNISSLVQLEYSGFDGAMVPICTFTLRNVKNHLSGEYIKLSDFRGSDNQPIKTREAILSPDVEYRYTSMTDNFNKIPGSPIAYWASDKISNIFECNKVIGELYDVKQGMTTADNNRFLRHWHEVNNNKVGYGLENTVAALDSKKKWFPYNKGGYFRKWYGNNEYVVNYENDGNEMKEFTSRLPQGTWVRLKSREYYFKESITWTFISSSNFGVRYSPQGFIFDVAGSSIFPQDNINYILGFLSTNLAFNLLQIVNPTLNYQIKDVKSLPIIINKLRISEVNNLVETNVDISKNDWDSFETSWDFKTHPLLHGQHEYKTIDQAFNNWQEFTFSQFNQLKSNEEELNRIFIEIYGLQDELTPEVEDKDITISVADRERDIKSFISYAIGCIFGRYSLDEEGLVYAGGEFDIGKYKTFPADKDNVLPIVSDAYFEDDIVSRIIDFVKITFGEEFLGDNLKYIADSLGVRGNETPRETIRRYLLNDFYKDHVRMYKKRPIYWLFTSGKLKTFNALIYMHRYDSSTLARIRTDYLHVLQSRLEGERHSLIQNINLTDNVREKKSYERDLVNLEKQLVELKEYDEILHHMADMKIEIDLDDGVKVNYEKFKGLLEKI